MNRDQVGATDTVRETCIHKIGREGPSGWPETTWR